MLAHLSGVFELRVCHNDGQMTGTDILSVEMLSKPQLSLPLHI